MLVDKKNDVWTETWVFLYIFNTSYYNTPKVWNIYIYICVYKNILAYLFGITTSISLDSNQNIYDRPSMMQKHTDFEHDGGSVTPSYNSTINNNKNDSILFFNFLFYYIIS